MVCRYRAAIRGFVEVSLQQLLHHRDQGAVHRDLAVLQDALQFLRLFQDISARVGFKQPGKLVFDVLEPALDDFRFGVSHDGVGHLDAQALKYRRWRERLLAVLRLLLAMTQAADVIGQEFAAIVHIDVLRDAVFQNAAPQRDQS